MTKIFTRYWVLRTSLCGLIALGGCATPAVVFISPDYNTQHVQKVILQGFSDVPNQPGSGAMVATVFEKYLFNLHYTIVDSANQADAVVSGSVTELTESSEQTVLVDIPQEVNEPIYQDVVVQGRHGRQHIVNEQTGSQTVITDQSVPETETLPARVGLSVRMVGVKNSELLWSGSGSADGMDIPSAAESVASKVIDALQKGLTSHKPT